MRVVFILIFLAISLNADDAYIRAKRLHQKLQKVERDIDQVLSQSRRTRDISIKFKKIAQEHRALFVGYVNQKAECKNLEDILQYRKSYSVYSFNLKKEKLEQCYENFRRINLNYKIINNDFIKLEKDIKIMMNMSSTDLSKIPSLKKQLNIIKKMLDVDKINIQSKKSSLKSYQNHYKVLR